MNEDEMIEYKEQMARIIAFDLCPQRYHKELYGENAKCYADNNFGDCEKIKGVVDKLYDAGYRKVADDEIIVKKRQYEQLKKYNRDRKRLRLRWQQAKQETREILQEMYDYCKEDVFGQVIVDFNCLETIARKYGIELED